MEQVLANIGYFLELWMIQIYCELLWETKFCFGRFSCFLFVWNGIVATLVNIGVLPKFTLWITYVMLIGHLGQCVRQTWKGHLVRFGGVLSATWVTDIVATIIVAYFNEYIQSGEMGFVLANVISVFIAGIIWFIVRRTIVFIDIGNGFEKLFGAILICGTAVVILMIDYYMNHAIQVLYDLLLAVVIIITYWYCNRVQKIEYSLKQQELENDVRRIYGKIYEESILDIRKRQHAFQNQLSAIYSSHKIATTLEELVRIQQEYCAALEEDSRYDAILLKCSEPVVAGFLYCKCLSCAQHGVSVEYEVSVNALNCKVLLHEFVEMLGILMDNAYEKVLESTDEEKRIMVRILESDGMVSLEVSNPSEYLSMKEIERMFFNGYSTKGSGRGLGLPRVRQITGKYGMDIQIMNLKKETNWIVFRIEIKK